jgi:RNA polymerase sigma factor (sigma-70 family)
MGQGLAMKHFHVDSLSDASDQDLVAWTLKGREEAFGELMHRYLSSVSGLIYSKVGNSPRTEDLTMHTFAKAYVALRRYRPERPFGPWIITIAAHTAIDYLRIRPADAPSNPEATLVDIMAEDLLDPALLAVDPLEEQDANSDVDEKLAQIFDAARQLRPDYRQCFLLYYVAHRSYREIAQTMEIPIGTVGTWLTRARDELKQILGKDIRKSLTGDCLPGLTPA